MLSSRNVSLCGGIDEALEAAALPQDSAEKAQPFRGRDYQFSFHETEPHENAGWGRRKAIGFGAAAETQSRRRYQQRDS